jgi:hypothetical protein
MKKTSNSSILMMGKYLDLLTSVTTFIYQKFTSWLTRFSIRLALCLTHSCFVHTQFRSLHVLFREAHVMKPWNHSTTHYMFQMGVAFVSSWSTHNETLKSLYNTLHVFKIDFIVINFVIKLNNQLSRISIFLFVWTTLLMKSILVDQSNKQ